MKSLEHAIRGHDSLEYLDISQNKIGNTEFKKIFLAVQTENSSIKTFCCRKNNVGGKRINRVLEQKSRNLEIIDLQQCRLDEQNARVLYEHATENINLEAIKLNKNLLINAQIMNEIDGQCRQNKLIREKILNQKKQIRKRQASYYRYNEYDNSSLVLENQRLNHIDFIQKFIQQNIENCHSLVLKNLDLHRCQGELAQMLSKANHFLDNLTILHIENIQLAKKPCHNLVKQLGSIKSLKELHLVNIEELENHMKDLSHCLSHLKSLQTLDLRQETLTKRKVDDMVILLLKSKSIRQLDISKAILSKQNMINLWVGLHKNISVCELNYSRINFFAILEMGAIDLELRLNQIIRDQIEPQLRKNAQEKHTISLANMQCDERTNPAIIKYIKMQSDLRSLDLSNTTLSPQDIKQFVLTIIKREIKLTSLNLSFCRAVNDDVVSDLCCLFSQNSTIKELLLDKTDINEVGLQKIFETIKQSMKVTTLSIKGCKLRLKGHAGRKVIEAAKDNISLTHFDFKGNNYNTEFSQDIKKELDLNKQIAEHIIPQLIEQEQKAREINQLARTNKRRKGRILNAKTDNKFESLESKDINVTQMRQFQKQGTLAACLSHSQSSNADKSPQLHRQKQQSGLNKAGTQTGSNSPSRFTDQNLNVIREESKRESRQSNRGPTPDPMRKTPSLYVKDTDSDENEREIEPGSSSISSENETQRLDSAGSDYVSDTDSSVSGQSGAGSHRSAALHDLENMQKNHGFNLSMKNMKIEGGIEFITKFTRVFKKIETLDFGDNQLKEDELDQFSKELQLNKYIQNVCLKKKGVNKDLSRLLEKEIKKNKAINDMQKTMGTPINTQSKQLNLNKLKDVSFLPKMLADFSNLEVLDLSDSDLRSQDAMKQLCKMIDENQTIEKLVLRRCMLNARALSILADALTNHENNNLVTLDIKENPIQDEQYKVLFGLLQNNKTLRHIDYSLYDETNIKKLARFRRKQQQGLTMDQIEEDSSADGHDAHHHDIPLWQKIIFPIWLWKSLIHDKHEAFRFKYDTVAIKRIETYLMPGIKRQLYYWSLVYYFLTFIAPYIFMENECEKTFSATLFYLYGVYLVLCGIWEIYKVIEIQNLLCNKELLHFNKWHVVELFMGSIARTDTFLDICFIHIIGNCWEEYIRWLIPSAIFATINLLFPLYMLLRLLKTDFGNALVQPYLESACFVSFIRENMLLATVLDSFCINNSFYFMGKPFVFGKLMGVISFFTQDAPQLTIHVMFKLFIFSEAQKKLKTQTLLMVGMMVSAMAVLISLFNMIMCSQNEFDPIVLERELMQRQRTDERRNSNNASLVKQGTMKHTRLLSGEIQSGLLASMSRKRVGSQKVTSMTSNEDLLQEQNPASPVSEKHQEDRNIMTRIQSNYNQQNVRAGGASNEMKNFFNYASSGQAAKGGRNQAKNEVITQDMSESDSHRQFLENKEMIHFNSDKSLFKAKSSNHNLSPMQQQSSSPHAAMNEAELNSQVNEDRNAETRITNHSPAKMGLIKRHKTTRQSNEPKNFKSSKVVHYEEQDSDLMHSPTEPIGTMLRSNQHPSDAIVMQDYPGVPREQDDRALQQDERQNLYEVSEAQDEAIVLKSRESRQMPYTEETGAEPVQAPSFNFAQQEYAKKIQTEVGSMSESEDADDAARTLE